MFIWLCVVERLVNVEGKPCEIKREKWRRGIVRVIRPAETRVRTIRRQRRRAQRVPSSAPFVLLSVIAARRCPIPGQIMLGRYGARSLLVVPMARQSMRVRALHGTPRARPCSWLPATTPIALHSLSVRRALFTSSIRRDEAKAAASEGKASPAAEVASVPSALPSDAPPPGRFARMLPPAWRADPGSGKSLRKMVALTMPEKKPLMYGVGLLLVSSSVTMSVPLTIGAIVWSACYLTS